MSFGTNIISDHLIRTIANHESQLENEIKSALEEIVSRHILKILSAFHRFRCRGMTNQNHLRPAPFSQHLVSILKRKSFIAANEDAQTNADSMPNQSKMAKGIISKRILQARTKDSAASKKIFDFFEPD
jgi:hypothetical protein